MYLTYFSECIRNTLGTGRGLVVQSTLWCGRSSDRSHLVDPLSHCSFQSMIHNWYGMVCIYDPLLLILNVIHEVAAAGLLSHNICGP